MKDWKKWIIIIAVFLGACFIPFQTRTVQTSILESFLLLSDYAREHVLLCLIPAFFIAGAIANFISQGTILKYLGLRANKWLAYSLASVSGTILSVCSCTVLPLFAGIYQRGAGLGPAIAFLYSGPAINTLAIILTARILGAEMGLARAIGAIIFSVVIGLIMQLIFHKEEKNRSAAGGLVLPEEKENRTLWKTGLFLFVLVLILIFLNWIEDPQMSLWNIIFQIKYLIVFLLFILLLLILIFWFKKEELQAWLRVSQDFALQIMPLLFGGVMVAGFLLGRPGQNGIIPEQWIIKLVGGNHLLTNFFAAILGAFMYFATLTEVPILQGLLGSGMGKGPALSLLLAGPALSLPNMLVIHSVIGIKKTIVYISLVIIMSAIAGWIFGYFWA